jgi:hypothetical protein
MELPERFWAKVDKTSSPNGCWLWTAAITRENYGVFKLNGKIYPSHRLTLAHHLGRPLADGMYATHQCPGGPNRACCNPAHLKEGTAADNMADMIRDGNSLRGFRNHSCKLTEDQVHEIRASDKGLTELGQVYGVDPMTIYEIRSGRSWTWLK